MLSVFPELFTYELLGLLLLRVFIGVVFFITGYRRFLRRLRQADTMTPPSHPTPFKVALGSLEVAIGLLLIVGVYMQIAALVGAILSIAYYFFAKRDIPTPGGRIGTTALLVICLSLLVLGPGAFAYDWPL